MFPLGVSPDADSADNTDSAGAPRPARRATIYDIARLAGLSPSAVGAILNGSWQKRRISAATAERVQRIARDQGYAVNRQASMLRRDRSHVIGMIVPKYDNRYFGAIAEQFEALARARDLFPVITCTQRDPATEFEAARELVSYQADLLVLTGASDPDRIADYCENAGIRTLNLDLPGRGAPSVVSDNFTAARDLTRLLLARMDRDFATRTPLWFVGGRPGDHNTAERLRGFRAAHAEAGLTIAAHQLLMPGYAPHKAAAALSACTVPPGSGMFINSTIALEGVVRWMAQHPAPDSLRLVCFDRDPFAALLPQVVAMAEQDVGAMLAALFAQIDHPDMAQPDLTLIPCRIHAV